MCGSTFPHYACAPNERCIKCRLLASRPSFVVEWAILRGSRFLSLFHPLSGYDSEKQNNVYECKSPLSLHSFRHSLHSSYSLS